MISLLVVNYRTSALAAEAIRTARETSSMPLQVVVVDNSLEKSEEDALRPVADHLVVADRNLGYAGGINAGRRHCSGETIVIANPDVTFAPSAIDLLTDALRTSWVSGPSLFWDAAFRWMLPPGDLGTGWQKVDEILASRSRAWFEQRDRRRFLRRVRFWSIDRTNETRMLSGAVIAVRSSAFDLVGGFDERFALYFEENDFLRRISEAHGRIVHVPGARCRHMYNRSAAQVPELAAARYAESELRYLEKWNGPFAARFLKKIERPLEGHPPPAVDVSSIVANRDDVVIEVSPLSTFVTAAGCFPESRTTAIPPEFHESAGVLYARTVVRATGEVVGTYRIRS